MKGCGSYATRIFHIFIKYYNLLFYIVARNNSLIYTKERIIMQNFLIRGGIKMIRGFKMKLYEGQEKEYEYRHNQLWPEMINMIHEYGGKNYTIFLDKETLNLFGYIEIEDEELWSQGADTAINRKWWDYMADIMETNPDNSPVAIDLKTVFHLD